MSTIADSGQRRTFDTGSVRDIQEGKGRMDLVPLHYINYMFSDVQPTAITILMLLGDFIYTGDRSLISQALNEFIRASDSDSWTWILEVSKHFEDGCNKYGERNWEKGIPAHSYIDSACRHLVKYSRGDSDEQHDRAFIWNLLCLLWTLDNCPDCVDLPYNRTGYTAPPFYQSTEGKFYEPISVNSVLQKSDEL